MHGLYDLLCLSVCVCRFYVLIPVSSGAAWATLWSCARCHSECLPFGTWRRRCVSFWHLWQPSSAPPSNRVQRRSGPPRWQGRPPPTAENGDYGSPLNGGKEKKSRGEEWDAYSMECISVSLRHHRALSRRWDHFQHGACMYLYFCRLLPAIKQIILKKLPTWISLAFYCSHCCIFSPYLTDRTAAHRLELQEDQVRVSGSAVRRRAKPTSKSSRSCFFFFNKTIMYAFFKAVHVV